MLDVIYTYFNQSNLLETYISHWNNNLSKEIRQKINFIIVDDYSTKKAIDVIRNENINFNLQCYYITENKGYNTGGARNLGVCKSKNSNILILDFDMVVYESLLQELLKWEINEQICYRFQQCTIRGFNFEKNKLDYKVLNSAMYLKKSIYVKAGGYDEDFSGNYGYEDVYFRDCLKDIYNIKFKYINKNKIWLEPTGGCRDANRIEQQKINKKLFLQKKKKYKKPNNILRFKYDIEFSNSIL